MPIGPYRAIPSLTQLDFPGTQACKTPERQRKSLIHEKDLHLRVVDEKKTP